MPRPDFEPFIPTYEDVMKMTDLIGKGFEPLDNLDLSKIDIDIDWL